jgi:hypothetical protein
LLGWHNVSGGTPSLRLDCASGSHRASAGVGGCQTSRHDGRIDHDSVADAVLLGVVMAVALEGLASEQQQESGVEQTVQQQRRRRGRAVCGRATVRGLLPLGAAGNGRDG